MIASIEQTALSLGVATLRSSATAGLLDGSGHLSLQQLERTDIEEAERFEVTRRSSRSSDASASSPPFRQAGASPPSSNNSLHGRTRDTGRLA